MTPEPASVGSVLDLIFEVTTGARVRARATVRTSRPGEGMGVKFVHIGSEDRSRLNHFLKTHLDAGNIEEDVCAGSGQPTRETEAAREAILAVPRVGSRWEMILLPLQNGRLPSFWVPGFCERDRNESDLIGRSRPFKPSRRLARCSRR